MGLKEQCEFLIKENEMLNSELKFWRNKFNKEKDNLIKEVCNKIINYNSETFNNNIEHKKYINSEIINMLMEVYNVKSTN